jgi:hypothetical protein
MSEKPIICSTESVRAILDDRKTITRRVMKPQPIITYDARFGNIWHYKGHMQEPFPSNIDGRINWDPFRSWCQCAPYQKGDLLWVKENWWDLGHMEKGKWQGRIESHTVKPRYVATCPDPFNESIGGVIQPAKIPWRQTSLFKSTWRKSPSRFMPKWVARIWLEVLNVRAEKLQEITFEEVEKEGVTIPATEEGKILIRITGKYPPHDYWPKGTIGKGGKIINPDAVYIAHFCSLWDSLNAKRGYGWEINPFVWRYEFKRIEQGNKNDRANT